MKLLCAENDEASAGIAWVESRPIVYGHGRFEQTAIASIATLATTYIEFEAANGRNDRSA